MRWVKIADGNYYLVVVPLHGRGNQNGEGEGAKVMAYKFPNNPLEAWTTSTIDNGMHLTHNFEILEETPSKKTDIYIAGKEGVRLIEGMNGKEAVVKSINVAGVDRAAGEIRLGNLSNQKFLATIEPMHGVAVAVYLFGKNKSRKLLDEQLK